jgi:hypothetical protein
LNANQQFPAKKVGFDPTLLYYSSGGVLGIGPEKPKLPPNWMGK